MTRSAIRKQHNVTIRSDDGHPIHSRTLRAVESLVRVAVREAFHENRTTTGRPFQEADPKNRYRVEVKDQGDSVPTDQRYLACLMDNYAHPHNGAALLKSAPGKTAAIALTELWSKLHGDIWMDRGEKAAAIEAVQEHKRGDGL